MVVFFGMFFKIFVVDVCVFIVWFGIVIIVVVVVEVWFFGFVMKGLLLK